ncbi:hypothetical protein [Aliiroseovarius sp. S253]|uniref:hypothetical protein n=1 Tax=Aliiroseovarius sp. S253 TaxID=3415133 RepID=UPI003C7B46A8
MKRYIPFVLIFGFLFLTWGFLSLNQVSDTRGKQFAAEALEALALCETAIMRGQLPDVSDWKTVRPLSSDNRSATYVAPSQTKWIAVKVESVKWLDGPQHSCDIQHVWSEDLLTRADVAAVVLTFMETRAARFGRAPQKPFDLVPLSQGDILYGIQTRDLVNDACPLGTTMTVLDAPYRVSFSVSDRFTWCSN